MLWWTSGLTSNLLCQVIERFVFKQFSLCIFYVLQYTILLLWIVLHYRPSVVNESKLFYKQITPATLPSWKTVSSVDKGASIESEKSYIRQDESQTVVEREEVIEGFKFGTTLVPFSGIWSFKIIKGCSDICYYKTDYITEYIIMLFAYINM